MRPGLLAEAAASRDPQSRGWLEPGSPGWLDLQRTMWLCDMAGSQVRGYVPACDRDAADAHEWGRAVVAVLHPLPT